jgi:hypothetical protein
MDKIITLAFPKIKYTVNNIQSITSEIKQKLFDKFKEEVIDPNFYEGKIVILEDFTFKTYESELTYDINIVGIYYYKILIDEDYEEITERLKIGL